MSVEKACEEGKEEQLQANAVKGRDCVVLQTVGKLVLI
jgi:hypothetical protein